MVPSSNPYDRYSARIIADSISPLGVRLTTMEVVLPRFVLAEFNTHRMFSRNSASSRAIPVARRIRDVLEHPFVPDHFPVNQPGMQSHAFLEGEAHEQAVRLWLRGRDRAVATTLELLMGEEHYSRFFGDSASTGFCATRVAEILSLLTRGEITGPNLHKQIANRPLEPWQWQTVLVTATEWGNFLALRTDGAAQREIHLPALLIQEALNGSTPHPLNYNQWHLPLIQPDELDLARQEPDKWVRISVGRCARVSYLTHDGRRDLGKDLELHDRLAASGHMSPLEHAARPMTVDEARNPVLKSNFRGWVQYRKLRPFENDRSLFLADQPD